MKERKSIFDVPGYAIMNLSDSLEIFCNISVLVSTQYFNVPSSATFGFKALEVTSLED